MQDRYALRFESGERKGEVVPVPAGRFTVGRRPGNSLQIPDASVSGQHAELVVDERGGARLRDLSSTNGTTLNGRRIEDASAAHGDRLAFGNVQLVFLDRELADEAPAARPPAPAAASAGEAVATVGSEKLARAGRRSRAGLLFGVAGVLAIGGAAYVLLGRSGEGGGRLRAPAEPPGNLLSAGYSFEGDESSWSADERATESFFPSSAARVSGRTGMRAELDPAEWTLLGSREIGAHDGQTLVLSAELRAEGGAGARAGIEFLRTAAPSDGAAPAPGPGPLRAFSGWIAPSEGFQRVELTAPVPPGTQRARVVIEGRAGETLAGSVDVDDVALVAEPRAAEPAGERGEYQLFLFGEPPQSAAVYKLGRPLIGDLSVSPAEPPAGAPRTVTLAAVREERRSRFEFSGAGGAAVLTLRVEPATVANGIATMGPGGYREHGPEFEREEATGILFGKGQDVAALRFEEPVAVRCVREGDAARVRVELGNLPRFHGQLDFSVERTQAGDLAHEARNAERDKNLGRALEAWRELLEEYPFEKDLVAEAEAARARLIQGGLEELEKERDAVERAQFFRLVEHFRLVRGRIEALAARYAGSEVEEAARALIAELDASLAVLEADLDRDELARLRSILAVLERTDSKGLAAEVRKYEESKYGKVD